MKRLLQTLLFFIVLIGAAKNVYAAEQNYIYLGDEIPGVRLHLKTPTVEKNKKMYEILNRNTGEHVYCIEPGVVLKNGYMTAYREVEDLDIDITDEDWLYLRLIAYLGYGYEDRTEIKWYAVTQFMIWEYILKDTGEVYFIDENNQKIDLYQEEIAMIQNDLDHYWDLPIFMEGDTLEVELSLNEELKLVDESGLLSKFTPAFGNQKVSINDNTLTASYEYPGDFTIYFSKETHLTAIPRIFYSPSSQMVMNRGIVNLAGFQIRVHVKNPSFTLIKESSKESDLSLANATYGIYYENGTLYKEVTTNEEGIFYLEEIDLGSYYLKELEAPYGYELSDEVIHFEVINENVVLKVEDKLIEKEITLEKYLEEIDGTLELENNAEFSIYNYSTKELLTTFKTNEYGKFTLHLPYGKYVIKQNSGHIGYHLSEDIILTVDDSLEVKTNIIVKNPKITGSLLIEKRDQESGNLIMDSALFQIINTDTNEVFSEDGVDTFKTEEGRIYIEGIPYGNYKLVEISAPENYQILESEITFSITSTEEITLKVENKLQNGSLVIEKLDKDDLKPLQGVLFGLYDNEKNLIQEYSTNEDGLIKIENMLPGLYYVKELSPLDGYELLEGFTEVEIKNNTLSTIKVTNRLEIEVPKTGTNEFILTILFSSFCLAIGAFICNYDKKD